jgi:hypothetical protein
MALAAACGGSSSHTSAKDSASTATTMMALPTYAKEMKLSLSSSAAGTTVTTSSIPVHVDAAGYQLSCDWAGKAPKAGIGHYHLLIDKSLINMYCTPDATVSMQNLKPGNHVLAAVPALNDHAEVEENAQQINFDYEPTTPTPAITDATEPGPPAIKIRSPKPGDSVSGNFDVVVQFTNFNPSCDLYGKPSLTGYGHWHLNLDTATGPMMGMGSMMGMSCAQTFHASTVGITPGTPHKLIAVLVDNGHAPVTPAVMDQVEVKVA